MLPTFSERGEQTERGGGNEQLFLWEGLPLRGGRWGREELVAYSRTCPSGTRRPENTRTLASFPPIS